MWSISSWLLHQSTAAVLTLDEGYLLTAACLDLERGVAPLGPPAPMQPRFLGCGVGPPSLTEHGPAHQTKTQFPLSQSLPSGSFHKPLILLHQRADRLKTTITEN